MGHDGMHYSLPSRELIADEVESMAEHQSAANIGDLTGLIERAACCVNMLSSADLSEAQTLLGVLAQIQQVAAEQAPPAEDKAE
jgi:hypothetical protein